MTTLQAPVSFALGLVESLDRVSTGSFDVGKKDACGRQSLGHSSFSGSRLCAYSKKSTISHRHQNVGNSAGIRCGPAKPELSAWRQRRQCLNQENISSRISTSCTAQGADVVGVEPTVAVPAFQNSPLQEGFIFGDGRSGSWDADGIGAPVVRRYQTDNEERWFMWYQGWKGSSQLPQAGVGLAQSSNGLVWSRGETVVETDARGEGGAGLVMAPSENWWTFDTRHVSVSDVLVMSSNKVRARGGVYWMYYAGGDAEELPMLEQMERAGLSHGVLAGQQVAGLRTRPGLAMSNDGRNWARIEGDHHSGALFDVGHEGEWDSTFIAAPQVVFHEAGDIRMYYHSLCPKTGKFVVGYARSRDGLKWMKCGPILKGGAEGAFDELGVAARHVIAHPSGLGYLMLYEGVAADGTRSIGLAQSRDGLWTWERVGDGPVFGPSPLEGAWDSKGVGSPCLVEMGHHSWRLYYVGTGADGKQGIGMAESENRDLTSFKRWKMPATLR